MKYKKILVEADHDNHWRDVPLPGQEDYKTEVQDIARKLETWTEIKLPRKYWKISEQLYQVER